VSGIDPAVSQLVAVHEAVVNATQTLLHCTCATDDEDLDEGADEPPLLPSPGNEVFAWTSHIYNASVTDYQLWDWSKITTVCVKRAIHNTREVIAHAKAQGVRSVVGDVDPDQTQLLNRSYIAQWVLSVQATVHELGVYGVNLDIEGATASPATRQAITNATCALRAALGNAFQISFDVNVLPNRNNLTSRYDFRGLARCVDFLVPMVYDLAFANSHPTACANSPLPAIAESVRQYGALGVAPSQLVMAFPWYGFDYACVNTTLRAQGQPCTLIMDGHARFGHWQVGYGSIIATVARARQTSVYWDNATSTPWIEYVDPHAPAAPGPGVRGRISQLWFDDARSLALKYKAATAEGVRGFAIWTADAFHDGRSADHNKAAAAALWGAVPSPSA
jgi:hypothetical protein